MIININHINKMDNLNNPHIALIEFIKFINNHEKKNDIVEMFNKDPPEDTGFLWWDGIRKADNGVDSYWNVNEINALKIIRKAVLDAGWDSSGYGFMMRLIQTRIKNGWPDDEGKGEKDKKNLINGNYYL